MLKVESILACVAFSGFAACFAIRHSTRITNISFIIVEISLLALVTFRFILARSAVAAATEADSRI